MESLIKINLYLELERIKTIIIPSSFDAFVFEAVNCNFAIKLWQLFTYIMLTM